MTETQQLDYYEDVPLQQNGFLVSSGLRDQP